jgi:hypothetical protein
MESSVDALRAGSNLTCILRSTLPSVSVGAYRVLVVHALSHLALSLLRAETAVTAPAHRSRRVTESQSIIALEKRIEVSCAVNFIVINDFVDQPVVTAGDDQLAQSFVSALGNDPTSPRELTE